jgi:hypothetical protein
MSCINTECEKKASKGQQHCSIHKPGRVWCVGKFNCKAFVIRGTSRCHYHPIKTQLVTKTTIDDGEISWVEESSSYYTGLNSKKETLDTKSEQEYTKEPVAKIAIHKSKEETNSTRYRCNGVKMDGNKCMSFVEGNKKYCRTIHDPQFKGILSASEFRINPTESQRILVAKKTNHVDIYTGVKLPMIINRDDTHVDHVLELHSIRDCFHLIKNPVIRLKTNLTIYSNLRKIALSMKWAIWDSRQRI